MSIVLNARSSSPSAAPDAADPIRHDPLTRHACLLALLIAEILFLTFTFDTRYLDNIPAFWARLVGWTPAYLRVVITALAVTTLVSGTHMWALIRGSGRDREQFTLRYLAIHLVVFVAFARVSAVLMGKDFITAPHQGLWAVAWLFAGGATVATWARTSLPWRVWLAVLSRGRAGIVWGAAAGSAAWAGGFLTQEFWKPLAHYTFSTVAWMLGWIYPDVVSDPGHLTLGTPSFSVNIAPACSGYEGIGLILTFLSISLWLSRKDLRFPRTLMLLPIGAATIWILNAVRIAILIVIGASGWPEVATGGFHSQAGWLSFNAVGLGFVALSLRARYFAKETAPRDVAWHPRTADLTTAYLAPFLAIVATSMLTGAFAAGFDWLYPVRVVAAGAVLWRFRAAYGDLKWQWSWSAIGIGAAVFLMWLALMPAGATGKDDWPAVLAAAPTGWATLWLSMRVVGYVITVPLAEELAFRGFLPRRLLRADFHALPLAFAFVPWVVSSLLFGVLHGQFWLAGTAAGAVFALALYRRRSLADAVQAHATTNALLALYALASGHWSAWS